MRVLGLSALIVAISVAAPTAAQPRCWDAGHSIRCAPGCVPLKMPRFPGDYFTWRCQRHAPPPPRFVTPPPMQPGCPNGMYPVTPTWCCPFGTIYRNGQCRDPQPRTYDASGPTDPTPFYIILSLIGLAFLAWYEHRTKQIAYARDTADTIDESDDISSAAERMQEAADCADEILRRFRRTTGDDP